MNDLTADWMLVVYYLMSAPNAAQEAHPITPDDAS